MLRSISESSPIQAETDNMINLDSVKDNGWPGPLMLRAEQKNNYYCLSSCFHHIDFRAIKNSLLSQLLHRLCDQRGVLIFFKDWQSLSEDTLWSLLSVIFSGDLWLIEHCSARFSGNTYWQSTLNLTQMHREVQRKIQHSLSTPSCSF